MTSVLSIPKTKVFQLLWVKEDSPIHLIEQYLNTHALTRSLRSDLQLIESRPHLDVFETTQSRNLLTGALAGLEKIIVAPIVFQGPGKSLSMLFHIGNDTCSHEGIIHGGLLATLINECLTRCCCPAFGKKVAVTANLNINYRSPAMVDSYFVVHAKITEVAGRKAWVDGWMETLSGDRGEPTLIAEAKSLFIEPKQAANLRGPYNS
ncbi:Adenylyl-sulfate kinase [Penicillium sp. IBT 16267x]|nr:Adenylyl-sulfate kinase [Penicillium sp. IBT 16267x]